MKIWGVVGSPRGDIGRTDALVQSALRGAKSEGADTEVMCLLRK